MSATAAILQELEQESATTRRVLEHILRDEEEHAEELKNLLPQT